MWPARYFPGRFFAAGYWSKGTVAVHVLTGTATAITPGVYSALAMRPVGYTAGVLQPVDYTATPNP